MNFKRLQICAAECLLQVFRQTLEDGVLAAGFCFLEEEGENCLSAFFWFLKVVYN